ncbi:hypothetical protein NEDG_00547 [Nematocida displodere]|uniref:Uncharacterized protein n=1 Tax=Nematocida displodere TaxID=1805483 RepID=A0A177EBT3_9MICR|nr:hypothetical protein NEDG_00547 [Nematocida displodere]
MKGGVVEGCASTVLAVLSVYAVYAFGPLYLFILGTLAAFAVLSFLGTWRLGSGDRPVRSATSFFLLAAIVAFYFLINTVFLLRLDQKLCSNCLVMTVPRIAAFYAYTALYAGFIFGTTYRFFNSPSSKLQNNLDSPCSSISDHQIATVQM